ncbi:MAG: homoserine O-succinyltransferase [Proteobacteria bacterium]|nr:homoserine O-succinyltransferase [Pseudomonadota bacterium]
MSRPLALEAFQVSSTTPDLGVDLFVQVPAGWRLASGEALPDPVFQARLYGPADAPLVIVAGGISASRLVWSPDGAGWWGEVVAPGAGVDLNRRRVLAFDFAPLKDARLAVTTDDQARLVELALDALGVETVHAFVGASYGGMVGLALAARSPERLERLCVISAAHRPSAMGQAWRGVQRRVFELARDAGRAEEGLALARELAMTTYRSAEEFDARFDRALDAEGLSQIDRYLIARGRAYAKAMAPERWWSLSRSIDSHAVEPEAVTVPTTLIASTSDRLTPLSDMAELASRLPDLIRFAEIRSLYGHDAFLKDAAALNPILKACLDA